MSARNSHIWLHTCPCGKRSFISRKDARHAAKVGHRGEHMSAYVCGDTGAWHIGHASKAVIAGAVAR